MVVLLSNNKIAGVSRILSVALRNNASIATIYDRLQRAIDGTYFPASGWTDREFAAAYLVKAYGGPRLLYSMQIAESYPSLTTLRRHHPVAEITVSLKQPNKAEMVANILSFLGPKTGRNPPANPLIGQVLMMDGVAIEEVCRFDEDRNCVLGVCREHSQNIDLEVKTVDSLKCLQGALHGDGICHHGKDATVAGIATVTGRNHYAVVPLILSSSCKSESGLGIANWITLFRDTYHMDPNGEQQHGPIWILATDGESAFRNLRFRLCLVVRLGPETPLGKILHSLPGLNLMTGHHGLIGTCDPKHIVKRCATLIRSPLGIQIGSVHISRDDIFKALLELENMTAEKAELLLNPADKQNVPKAVNLLQSLFDLSGLKITVTPNLLGRIHQIVFLTRVLTCFLFPFIKVGWSLSQQIKSLSTYSHLLTALYIKHKTSFITSALYADSQAIVKNIIFTTARLLQLNNPDIEYFILLEGTDRLEEVFSHSRTHDHSRNFDILQFAHKLSIGAEINRIFERFPEFDRGHVRRDLVDARGVDHVNPTSWKGNVKVGDVDLAQEYFTGRDEANDILVAHFGPEGYLDFAKLFSDPDVDHLRPRKKYIGSQLSEAEREDEIDSGDFASDENSNDAGNFDLGTLGPLSQPDSTESEDECVVDMRNDSFDDLDDLEGDRSAITPEMERLNIPANNSDPEIPSKPTKSLYLEVDGMKQHKSSLVPRFLESPNARKVTVRPLRARGVTIANSIQQQNASRTTYGDDGSVDLVKAGDIGAILVRVSNALSLAVVEILSFRTSGKNLASVPLDDLDRRGAQSITISIQILNLEQLQPIIEQNIRTLSTNFDWISNQSYAQILKTDADGTLTSKHFVAKIPGLIFHPLGPDIHFDAKDMAVWSLKNSDLQDVMEEAWDALNPSSDEVMSNIALLPEIAATNHLPYRLPDGSIQLYYSEEKMPFHLRPEVPNPDLQVPCLFCDNTFAIRKMRNHVGKHILRSIRHSPDRTVKSQCQVGITTYHYVD
jgi:hypothetical protein